MGGGAFSHAFAEGKPTLNTPRMSPDIYSNLKHFYTERLRSYFPPNIQVASLTEAPEKADYGDLDFIIAYDDRVDFFNLATYLGAVAVICPDAQNQKCTMAFLRDGSRSPKPVVIYKHVNDNGAHKLKPSSTVSDKEYAQMDIGTVPTQFFEWHIFYSSYGDMGGLVGHIVHNLGFTVNDRGFWLRMKELDDSKKPPYKVDIADRDGKFFLSHDPEEVMQFLGLSVLSYCRGFKTLDALYSWLGKCKLISWEAVKVKKDNSSERNREQKRIVYSKFFNEWLPAHLPHADAHHNADRETTPDEESNTAITAASRARLHTKRAELVQEALDFFGKEKDYTAMHTSFTRHIQSSIVAQLLKPILRKHNGVTDKNLNEVVRAFRRWVAVSADGQLSTLEEPRIDAESELWRLLDEASPKEDLDGGTEGAGDETGLAYRLKNEGHVNVWAGEHWKEVRSMERQKTKEARV